MTRRPPNRRSNRLATVSIEALFVVPILLVLAMAVVEFSLLIAAEQKLAEASGVAARTAAVGRSDADVKAAVKAILGPKQYSAADVDIARKYDRHLGDVVEVRIALPAKVAAPCVLRSCGVKMSADKLVGRTLMRVE